MVGELAVWPCGHFVHLSCSALCRLSLSPLSYVGMGLSCGFVCQPVMSSLSCSVFWIQRMAPGSRERGQAVGGTSPCVLIALSTEAKG